MVRNHVSISTSDGKRKSIKASAFRTPEMREFINSLAPQVLNKTLDMSQAGFQIYRRLGLEAPALQGAHWMWKSAARFNGIEPWASHKLMREKKTDPIKLTVDGLKLISEIKRKKYKTNKKFIKLKTGLKIPIEDITTESAKAFITPLCEKVTRGVMGEMDAGREVYQFFNRPIPAAGTFWLFKAVAKYNGIEPWASERKGSKKKELEVVSIHHGRNLNLPEDFVTRIKNLEADVRSLTFEVEKSEKLKSQFEDMKVSLDLLMDTVSKIASAEGIHISAENNKEIVLRVPSNLFFKQAAIVEDVKIEEITKGKKIVIVGPESSQIRNFTERLPGAILNFFTGKNLSEKEMLLQKCENADVIVVWPRFTGHWATGCTRQFKDKCITTRAAGVKTTVDEIIERLKWS